MKRAFQLFCAVLILLSLNFSCKKKEQSQPSKETIWLPVGAASGFNIKDQNCVVTSSDILCLGNYSGFRRIDCKTNKLIDEVNIIRSVNNNVIPHGFNKLFHDYYVSAEGISSDELAVSFYFVSQNKIDKVVCSSNIFVPQNRGFVLNEINFQESSVLPPDNIRAIASFNSKDSAISSILEMYIGNNVVIEKNEENGGANRSDQLIRRYKGDLILNFFAPKNILYFSDATHSYFNTFYNYSNLFLKNDSLFCVKADNGQYDIYTSAEGENWEYLNSTKEDFSNTFVVDNKLIKVKQNKISYFDNNFNLKDISRDGLPYESGKIIASRDNLYFICDAGVFYAPKSKLF